MTHSQTLKANSNTVKILDKMMVDKKEHRKKIIANIKEKDS